ncbi:MAG TPA: acyl-CoA thioesterase domain-containing protein [Ilumatobacteraceae bacterium]|nr:acyl-CoA thioesterase domain-containing protein [Ilumatobacteraceae bacterium]
MLATFDFLDLQKSEGDGHYRLAVRPDLSTPSGFLYGGSGIAASIEAAERTTDRPPQWITTQFIGSPAPGSAVELQVTVLAEGRVTSQSPVVATVDGAPVFTSMCAHTIRPGVDTAQFVQMPGISGPDDCPNMGGPFAMDLSTSFFRTMEHRLAAGTFGMEAVDNPQHASLSIWCRIVATRLARRRRRHTPLTSFPWARRRDGCDAGSDQHRQHLACHRYRAD